MLTDEQKELVKRLLVTHRGNYMKVSRSCNIRISEIEEFDIVLNQKYNMTKEGTGPKRLRKYIVATRHAHNPVWSNKEAIEKARDEYNRGLVELATGRDGMTLILYKIKRKIPVINRKPWFVDMCVEMEQENGY